MKKLIYLVLAFFLLSSATNAQWTQSLNKPGVTFYRYTPVLGTDIYYLGSTPGVYKSTNVGATWVRIDHDSIPFAVNTIQPADNNGHFLVGTSNGVFRSLNDSTWVRSGLVGVNVLCFDGSPVVWAGTTNGLYKSTDAGVTWQLPQLPGIRVNSILMSYNYLATNQGLYRSTNSGTTWFVDSVVNATYNCNFIYYWGGFIVGHSTGFLYRPNSGTWFSQQIGNTTCFALIDNNRALIASDAWGVILLRNTNGSLQTTVKNQGIPTTNIKAVQGNYDQTYVFASTGQNVYRAPQSYVPVEKISSEVPNSYALEQNYPNPFNPSTEIRYTVPIKGLVTLKVYDLLGRVITTLVNETQIPGIYTGDWNAGDNPSGVYFYRLQTNNFTDTKRMVLVK